MVLKRLKTYNRIFLYGLIIISIGVSLFSILNEINRQQALEQVQGGFQVQFLWAVPASLVLAGVMDCFAMLFASFLVREKRTGRLFQKRS